jgi:hypothetical protein
MTKSNNRLQRYRAEARREKRIKRHANRGLEESRIMEFQRKGILEVLTKDVNDDFTPTDYFIVEFNLEDKMSLIQFRNMLSIKVCEMLWENHERKIEQVD